MTNSLIHIAKVIHSIQVRDEVEYIKDPLYRELRWADIQQHSMSRHRSYAKRLLPLLTTPSEQHDWLIRVMANLRNRLESSTISSATQQELWDELLVIMTDTDDCQLRAHRETVLKIMM